MVSLPATTTKFNHMVRPSKKVNQEGNSQSCFQSSICLVSNSNINLRNEIVSLYAYKAPKRR